MKNRRFKARNNLRNKFEIIISSTRAAASYTMCLLYQFFCFILSEKNALTSTYFGYNWHNNRKLERKHLSRIISVVFFATHINTYTYRRTNSRTRPNIHIFHCRTISPSLCANIGTASCVLVKLSLCRLHSPYPILELCYFFIYTYIFFSVKIKSNTKPKMVDMQPKNTQTHILKHNKLRDICAH